MIIVTLIGFQIFFYMAQTVEIKMFFLLVIRSKKCYL